MEQPRKVLEDVFILPSQVPIPGLGVLPINAYLIRSAAPVLVDTGAPADADALMQALQSLLDPSELRWVWLTHTDRDHTGSLLRVLEAAPLARVVTTFLGAGKLGLDLPVPPERLYFLNAGQSMEVGGRRLTALRPPVFDAPETTGLYDSASGALFSSDCFGAVLSGTAHEASALPTEELVEGQRLWTTIDAPWIHGTGEAPFLRELDAVRRLAPKAVLSSHLPPAFGITEQLLDTLVNARRGAPFVGPDQAAFEEMLAAA